MNEFLAIEHQSDLLREAAAHHRYASRAAKAGREHGARHGIASALRIHRPHAAVGCEA
jgi:hypothetical protein